MNTELNPTSMDVVCAALTYALGVEAPACAAAPSAELCAYIDEKLGGAKADRILMYNPDAVGQWLYEKYPQLFREADARAELRLPLRSVMPSVTPVNFGTMYTGAQPAVHGIVKYAKPVIRIDTLFDALLRAGKRPVIIASPKCSMGNIFLEREMDYFLCDSIDAINAKAAQIIIEDQYDVVIVYNGNYDSTMHKKGPESIEALSELRHNVHTFAMLCEMVKRHWRGHDTLVGFAMDHGCHEIDGDAGAHGLDMPEDCNVTHLYRIYPAAGEEQA